MRWWRKKPARPVDTDPRSRSVQAVPAGARTAPADLDPLALLKKMLAYGTQNYGEGGVTGPHAEMLKAVWESAGVSAEIVPTPKQALRRFQVFTGPGPLRHRI